MKRQCTMAQSCFNNFHGVLVCALMLSSSCSRAAALEENYDAVDEPLVVGADATDPLYLSSPAVPNIGSVVIEVPAVMCNPIVSCRL